MSVGSIGSMPFSCTPACRTGVQRRGGGRRGSGSFQATTDLGLAGPTNRLPGTWGRAHAMGRRRGQDKAHGGAIPPAGVPSRCSPKGKRACLGLSSYRWARHGVPQVLLPLLHLDHWLCLQPQRQGVAACTSLSAGNSLLAWLSRNWLRSRLAQKQHSRLHDEVVGHHAMARLPLRPACARAAAAARARRPARAAATACRP